MKIKSKHNLLFLLHIHWLLVGEFIGKRISIKLPNNDDVDDDADTDDDDEGVMITIRLGTADDALFRATAAAWWLFRKLIRIFIRS